MLVILGYCWCCPQSSQLLPAASQQAPAGVQPLQGPGILPSTTGCSWSLALPSFQGGLDVLGSLGAHSHPFLLILRMQWLRLSLFSQEFGLPGIFFLVEMMYEGCSDSCPSTCSWSGPGDAPVPIHTLNLFAAGLCSRQIFHMTCCHPALPQPGISSGECR